MTTFHVRHDFNPTVAREALLLLRFQYAPNGKMLLKWADEREMEIGRRKSAAKILSSLRDLGLLKRPAEVAQRGTLSLTELGQKLADVAIRDRLLFAELIHLRYWWLWTATATRREGEGARGGEGNVNRALAPSPSRSLALSGPGFAWAYQTVSNMLWQAAPTSIDRNLLVSTILAEAPPLFDVRAVSFSSSSIQGILHWLKALSPPCITTEEGEGAKHLPSEQFRRRPSCPPESLVIALEGAKHVAGTPKGMPFYLDVSVRECVCRATLLDNKGFEEVLSEAEDMGLVTRLTSSRGEAILIRESLFPGLISVNGDGMAIK